MPATGLLMVPGVVWVGARVWRRSSHTNDSVPDQAGKALTRLVAERLGPGHSSRQRHKRVARPVL